MAFSLPKLVIIAPLLAGLSCAWASEADSLAAGKADPFGFQPDELDLIRFTRSKVDPVNLSTSLAEEVPAPGRLPVYSRRQTEVSFKLKPKRPDFSREGAYGLDLFTDPHLDIQRRLIGPAGISEAISELNDGFEYSAGVRIEHEDEAIDGTAYVSSSLLGLSYGRLGRLWYGGIDVNLEQFTADPFGEAQPDVLSLDVTTGRRLSITGLSMHSPLWLLSVQGNFDILEGVNGSQGMNSSGDWYLNPSLFWQQPGFTFSAQMQVPVEFETLDDKGKPDYRLRAVFEKQFR